MNYKINKICILISLLSFITFINLLIEERNRHNFIFNRFLNETKSLYNKNTKNPEINQFENKSKIIAISYSNSIYQTQLQYCKKSALEIGKVDEFFGYKPRDIDYEFRRNNTDILSRNRGNGYWLWKPYFILKTLKDKLNFGDYLIYTDAGVLYKQNVNILINFLEKKNEDMWFYKLSTIEKFYAKRDAFILMGADNKYYSETLSYNAAFQLYKKTKFTLKFVEDYLYYSKDKRIITDDSNTQLLPNYNGFIDNRHDQTVLSLLIKKYNLANSGKTNINYTIINNLKSNMPFIFCHYRKLLFKNYDDLKKNCSIK